MGRILTSKRSQAIVLCVVGTHKLLVLPDGHNQMLKMRALIFRMMCDAHHGYQGAQRLIRGVDRIAQQQAPTYE
eukprot:scaffold60321_cov32-Tisochrysis_lutea.AAC.3